MLARTYAISTNGTPNQLVTVECDITNGLPGITIVGLGDKAVAEARERIRSAIRNSGLKVPPRRITLNLAPANLRKDGSGYDLPMAAAILAATSQVDRVACESAVFLGELSLAGDLQPTRGAGIAPAIAADKVPHASLFIPSKSQGGLPPTGAIDCYAVDNLRSLVAHLNGQTRLPRASTTARVEDAPATDMREIRGQASAKRALEIAAAGHHSILLWGPPGTGKSLLAQALPGIVPRPSERELGEIAQLELTHLPGGRPFRAPHHTINRHHLVGSPAGRIAGELRSSHRGILLLDEMPEFGRATLESLRQPLEDGSIAYANEGYTLRCPTRFMLVGTMNLCPCGRRTLERECECRPGLVRAYLSRLSGALLDRIDLSVYVPNGGTLEVLSDKAPESSVIIRTRTEKARQRQRDRGYECNAELTLKEAAIYCELNNTAKSLLAGLIRSYDLSARATQRILKVARTIADLAGDASIFDTHISEALYYRTAGVRPLAIGRLPALRPSERRDTTGGSPVSPMKQP
jgi:magnesium chelatase family protein